MREYMTEKEIDDLVKEIMDLPRVESNHPVSTIYGFDVDTLINTLHDFKRLPTYDEVLKQNKELKKQLEEINNFINKAGFVNIQQLMLDYCAKVEQQKKFIEWLEKESKELIRDAGYHQRICLDVLEKYKEIIKIERN